MKFHYRTHNETGFYYAWSFSYIDLFPNDVWTGHVHLKANETSVIPCPTPPFKANGSLTVSLQYNSTDFVGSVSDVIDECYFIEKNNSVVNEQPKDKYFDYDYSRSYFNPAEYAASTAVRILFSFSLLVLFFL